MRNIFYKYLKLLLIKKTIANHVLIFGRLISLFFMVSALLMRVDGLLPIAMASAQSASEEKVSADLVRELQAWALVDVINSGQWLAATTERPHPNDQSARQEGSDDLSSEESVSQIVESKP